MNYDGIWEWTYIGIIQISPCDMYNINKLILYVYTLYHIKSERPRFFRGLPNLAKGLTLWILVQDFLSL